MIRIPIRTHVSAEGTITLHIPPEFRNQEIEAYLMVQPRVTDANITAWREELQSLAGSISDETFVRGEQGTPEVREEL